jgi:hypothetical protein
MSFSYGWRGPNIVKDRLVLYLDAGSPNSYINGISTTTYKDISGLAYNATLINSPTFNSSNKGYFTLDGTNNFIRMSTNTNYTTNLFPRTTDFSLSIWVNISSSVTGTYRQIWWGNAGGGAAGFGVFLNNINNNMFVEIAGTTGTPIRQQKNLGAMDSYMDAWHQYDFVITQSDFSLKFYIDSVLISTQSFTNWGDILPTGAQSTPQIGALNVSPPIWFFRGSIGPTLVYKNKALTSEEILKNFNANKTRFGL